MTTAARSRRFYPLMALLICLAGPALEPASAQAITLTSDAEVRRHYNGLQQALRQLNADELQRLYDEYRAARAAISDENAERSATLLAENRASHEALRREEPNAAARARRTDEIQAAYAAASAERQDWYLKVIESLESQYASDRAERRGLLDTEISVLSEQMNTALALLRAGADRVTAPAVVSLPGGATGALPGPALSGEAIDRPVDDERLQAAVPDIELHSIQWNLSGDPGNNRWSFPQDGRKLELDTCTRHIVLMSGYTVHLGDAPTEAQVAAVPITGFMQFGRQELARIDEAPYFRSNPRDVPDRPAVRIQHPHGFGWITGELDVGFGEFELTVVVDDGNRVIESNENNNRKSISLLVVPEPGIDLDCSVSTFMSEAVPDESPASGRVADVGVTSNTAIPDENAARAALSAANLVVELDTPMSRLIRVTNAGRTATDREATMTIACRTQAGEPCLPSYAFQDTLARPATIPPLEPGATHEHYIGAWPHTALWGPGQYTFEVELNANNAVAESARGNVATSTLTGANHASSVIVDYCQGCHRSDNRGDGPPPSELVEWEAEDGLDALVEAVIEGPVGMGSKAEIFWLPDSRVPEVVRALLDQGR